MLFFKQFGVGLAAAILIDATIVRGVLLPATMKLLGERNWYLPAWLEWLPHFDHGELEIDDGPEPEPKAPRQPRRKRAVGAARITGLVLIVLVAIGLAYVKIASGGDSVTVPAGAKAGQLTLHPCHYGTEQGGYAADCGTLVVLENRHDPHSRLIALPVIRIEARSDHPGAPVFRLEGGPGISNMHFSKASRIADRHDVVLVGYRGVDGSVRLDCPEVESALKRSDDLLGARSFRAYADGFRSCAARLQAEGVDLAGYSIPAQVDDLEAARRALGYGPVDLLSESAGTRTAMIYAWRYPKGIHRSVMIGVNPPGRFLWAPQTTDAQIERYSRLCAGDASCRSRTDDLAASMRRTAAHMPDRFWGLPFDANAARIASFYGLMESTADAALLSAPMTLGSWLSAAKGDASGFWFMSLLARMAFPESFAWGELAAMGRADTLAAKRYFAKGPHRSDSILGNPGTEFLYAGGRLIDAWPAAPDENEYARVRDSQVETLLIGGTLDVATPAVNAARELLPHLPNGHQVVLAELGHTASFWGYEPKASTRLLNTFLDTGKVDRSLYTPAKVDFAPEVTQTALGKGFAATMFALPAVVLASLLAMWSRSHRRGRFGRKASVVLRSAYVLVLGLGGWLGGVVVALVAFPTLPLDDLILAVLSIGVPVGLGVYLAWVDRDTSATKVGLCASVLGALLGAGLGFQVGTGLLAVVTTIAGAGAGANLLLLGVDVWLGAPGRVTEERGAAVGAAYGFGGSERA
jgi:pimeloyl-ACP methyl ester carboxylesterase